MEGMGVTRRSSIARSIALLACPVLVSGCIVGFPFLPIVPDHPIAPPPATPAPSVPLLPSPTARAELPDLPIARIPGAPTFAIWTALPDARIRVSAWRDGGIAELIVVPLLNRDPVYLDHVRVSVAPTGRFVTVVEAADGPSISRAFVRVFSIAGALVWTGPRDTTANPTIRWSPDGSRMAVDARNRWLVITPDDGPATALEIDSRRAVATGEGAYPWELLDFSEDGRTLFGSRSLGLPPGTLPLASVPSGGGAIQPIAALPTAESTRLAPLRQLMDRPLEAPIDPLTGRVAIAAATGSSTQITIVIRSGTTEETFSLPESVSGPVDLAWQRGSLVILHDGPAAGTQQLGIASAGADRGTERRVASFPLIGQRGRLVALTNGFAILAFGRGLGEVPNRLLVIRLLDGAETLVDADGLVATTETFGFAGWLPLEGPALAVGP